MGFLLYSFVSRGFLVLLVKFFFYLFFHLRVFNLVCFQYSPVFVSFPFSGRSDFLLIWLFYFFGHLSFSAFQY